MITLGGPYKTRRKIETYLVLFATVVFISCKSDSVQLPDRLLEGQIGGEEWSFSSANAYLISTDFQYRVRFLSSEEVVSDPCTLPNPSRAHISAVFRMNEGSFTLSPTVIIDNEVQVFFELSPGQSLIATNGFMEIFAIQGRVAIGYLQAALDDGNTVEGSFEIRICNG